MVSLTFDSSWIMSVVILSGY